MQEKIERLQELLHIKHPDSCPKESGFIEHVVINYDLIYAGSTLGALYLANKLELFKYAVITRSNNSWVIGGNGVYVTDDEGCHISKGETIAEAVVNALLAKYGEEI